MPIISNPPSVPSLSGSSSSIVSSDVQWYLSNPQSSGGYQNTGAPGSSLGGYMSTTQVNPQVPLDALFLDLSAAENVSGEMDYQCVFIMNNTATSLLMKVPYIWIPAQLWTTGGAGMAIAADPIGPVPYNSTSPMAATISNTYAAPSTVSSWNAAPQSQYQSGVLLGGLPPQYCAAIWLQRTANNSLQVLPQQFSLQCTFVTDAA